MTRSLLLLLLLAGCSVDDVVLANLPPNDGGGPPPRDERCLSSAECPSGKICEKKSCGGDEPGRCRPFPAVCDGTLAPVCGCDGVTYFNDCLRRVAGIEGAVPGECEATARECAGDALCPAGASCARLLGTGPDRCGPNVRGRCWVLPGSCPPDPGSDRWEACGPPVPGQPRCVDTCSAIRGERPAFRQSRCD